MRKVQKISLLLMRLGIGWLFFYAGITKVLSPSWSAAGYLEGAHTFTPLFAWFARPENIGWVNAVNEWGLTLVGILLILGLFVKYASIGGIVLMALYYFPVLSFPIVGEHSYIVDEHVIYITLFITLAVFEAGRYWGLDALFRRK